MNYWGKEVLKVKWFIVAVVAVMLSGCAWLGVLPGAFLADSPEALLRKSKERRARQDSINQVKRDSVYDAMIGAAQPSMQERVEMKEYYQTPVIAYFVCNQETEELSRVTDEKFEECRELEPKWRIQEFKRRTWNSQYQVWTPYEYYVLMKDRTYYAIVKEKLQSWIDRRHMFE